METVRPDWDEQFRETAEERSERWRAIKAKRRAEGKCWQCAEPVAECTCPNVRRAMLTAAAGKEETDG